MPEVTAANAIWATIIGAVGMFLGRLLRFLGDRALRAEIQQLYRENAQLHARLAALEARLGECPLFAARACPKSQESLEARPQ